MIEYYQGQTGEVAKRPQQVRAFQKRWAEISWAKRCQHPQHAIEQSFDPHNRALYRQEDRGHDAHGEGQQLLHQIECIQSHAAPVGADKASLAPSGLLGSAKQSATVLTEIGKTLADCENPGTARSLRRRITGPSCARVHTPTTDGVSATKPGPARIRFLHAEVSLPKRCSC